MMKKFCVFFIAYVACLISVQSHNHQAGDGLRGDTIRVFTHHNEVVVTDPSKGENRYTGRGIFPSADIPVRKITMFVHFACPDTMRCADWDYADRIVLGRSMGTGNDSTGWEIGRIITPYGGFFGKDWKFTWQTDVSDFSMILRDTTEVIYIHSGYEPNHDRGWLVSVEFEIITGRPVAQPLSVIQVYNENYEYGNRENPMEQTLKPFSFTAPANATHSVFRILQTGHGMDKPDNCAEFCSKYRLLFFDGKQIQKRQMWKKCGFNPVFPQAGTWIFDRANWCPGDLLHAEIIHLNIFPGREHSVHLSMEPYEAEELNHGAQSISAYLIHYGQIAAKIDVSAEDIIVPSAKDIYSKLNPDGANPVVIIRNNGSSSLTSLNIEYGTKGFPFQTFLWKGELGYSEADTITLPGIIHSNRGLNRFELKLVNPNGIPDEYPADNHLSSLFYPAPQHASPLVFYLLTNNEPEHNSWQLSDSNGKIIRTSPPEGMTAATSYYDTLFLEHGAYSLHFIDTMGDGLEFWYNTEGGRGEAMLFDSNKNLIKAFEPDCGSGWVYNFVIGSAPDMINPDETAISLYPVRTSDFTNLSYFSNTSRNILMKLISDPGGEVMEEHLYPNLRQGVFRYELFPYPHGRYYLKLFFEGDEIFNKRIRYIEPAPKE
jgi:hypothetical protein